MNDKTEDPSAEDISSAEEPREREVVSADEPLPDETSGDGPADAPVPPEKKASSGAGVGALALVIALAAAAGSGYVWYQQQAQVILEARVAELSRDADRQSKDLDRLLDQADELTRIDRDLDGDIAALTTRIEKDFEQVPERLTRLETTIEKVPGISQKARSAWLRSEAEYFLRVANAQLNLAGNVAVSLRALELADEQLRDLADPALTPVREAISDERAALKAVPQPDAEGIVLTLGSLARTIDSLPLANAAPGSYRGEDQPPAEESGWQRAWRSVVEALKSIISVKRDDQDIAPLLTAAEESMLIRSLDVDLQIARLGAIRNEGELYRSSIESVSGRLRAYFDTGATDVAAALETLDELAQAELPEQLPDISTSLRLLLNAPGGAGAE